MGKFNLKVLLLLSAGHMVVDIYQGALPTVLPFLKDRLGLSYTMAGVILIMANLTSSIIQPLFGFLSDRRSRPWLIPVAMLCAGVGVSLTGWVPNFWLGVLVVGLAGLGMAAFHPEGARLIHALAGDRKATAMSFFAISGQLGFVIGPLMATAAMLLWGLKGSISLVVPTAIVAGLVWSRLNSFSSPGRTQGSVQGTKPGAAAQTAWVPFVFLSLVLLSRSVIFHGLNTFLPLFWLHDLNQSKAAAGTALTVLMASSIAGNLLGGRLGDRFGYRIVAVIGFVCQIVLLPLFTRVGSPEQALLMLVPAGVALSIPVSPMVVLGQEYLPSRVGLASGVTLGLAFSFGGILMPALGWVADRHGLHSAISLVTYLPILCTVLTLPLFALRGASRR